MTNQIQAEEIITMFSTINLISCTLWACFGLQVNFTIQIIDKTKQAYSLIGFVLLNIRWYNIANEKIRN